MRQAVLDAFPAFTERFEGYTLYPYLDIKGLVTIGIGNLIDPIETALGLPWVDLSGASVPVSEVSAQLGQLKARQELRGRMAGYQAAFTSIRLTHAGVGELVADRMRTDDAYLMRSRPWYVTAPADAQMGALSMAWAMGPAFQFPKFEAFCEAGDFAGASTECHISTTGNPGVASRNSANITLFANAAAVLRNGWDPDTLHWPWVAA